MELGHFCAFCRHWMLGSIDLNQRIKALANDTTCTCHVKQPKETHANDRCDSFFEQIIINQEE